MQSTKVTAGESGDDAAGNANGKSAGAERGECDGTGGARGGSGGEDAASAVQSAPDELGVEVAARDGPRPAASNGSTKLHRSVIMRISNVVRVKII